jgi:hypothetical protein
VESEPTLGESTGQVAYLVESNKFQVRANAGGDEAKRERKFLLGGLRIEKSSLFGRSSHDTEVEMRRSKVRKMYLGERRELLFWRVRPTPKGLYPSSTSQVHCSGRRSAQWLVIAQRAEKSASVDSLPEAQACRKE